MCILFNFSVISTPAGFKGPTSKGREGRGGKGSKGSGGEGRERERWKCRVPPPTFE